MKRQRRLYEGRAKILYEGSEPGTYIQFFKDNLSTPDGKKQQIIEGKGSLNNRISEYLFTKLNQIGIPTHFIRRINMYEQLIKAVEIIPLKVMIRNIAAGSFAKKFGLEEGSLLPHAIIEFYYKCSNFSYPLVSNEHITAFGWASSQEIDDMIQYSIRINDFLSGLFAGKNISLVDFTLEFGRLWHNDLMQLVVADEISPDTARLWDSTTSQKLDKDLFQNDNENIITAYYEIANRLNILRKTKPSHATKPALVQ